MGTSKYEPPNERTINDFLAKKEKIINKHLSDSTLPSPDEIQLVTRMDIDIFEFLTKNITSLENQMERTTKKNVIARLKAKLDFYIPKKEKYDELNLKWSELLGYEEEVKKLEKEKEEAIKEKILNNKYRKSIFTANEEEEEEEEVEEMESKDYYYRSPFYEENPKMVGENKDKFDSLLQIDKNEEEIMKEKYPFDF